MSKGAVSGFWANSELWSLSEALRAPKDIDRDTLRASGLFDPEWYLQTNPDVAQSGSDASEHYLDYGWRESRWPNPYFDPDWYMRDVPEDLRSTCNPVLDYILAGEAKLRSPSPHFDLSWYASCHEADPGRSLLAHFLGRKFTGLVSPVPEFDPLFYLSSYPDIGAAGVDPFEHYLLYGYREGRNPSAEFDTSFYLRRYLEGSTEENPLIHYRLHRHHIRLQTKSNSSNTDVFAQVRKFCRAGLDFEEISPLPRSARRMAKVLAYYLPQFHEVAENNAWWGRGFTEWTAISRAMPRFHGHYQPRTPRDLGHYSLATADAATTMRRQIEMAIGAGLFGFVHYYYWFNGGRLLEQPLEVLLSDDSLDFPFCLMWANENWTRRWDGSNNDVLIAQDYRPSDDAALIDSFVRHFRDRRYIRIDGRPLLMLYRSDIIPDIAVTIERWRRLFMDRHGENPLLVMAQSFNTNDPRPAGFDGAIEFPPHKLATGVARRNAELNYFDSAATAEIYCYDDIVSASLDEAPAEFPLIKTVVPSWDNDARRQGAGLALHG